MPSESKSLEPPLALPHSVFCEWVVYLWAPDLREGSHDDQKELWHLGAVPGAARGTPTCSKGVPGTPRSPGPWSKCTTRWARATSALPLHPGTLSLAQGGAQEGLGNGDWAVAPWVAPTPAPQKAVLPLLRLRTDRQSPRAGPGWPLRYPRAAQCPWLAKVPRFTFPVSGRAARQGVPSLWGPRESLPFGAPHGVSLCRRQAAGVE